MRPGGGPKNSKKLGLEFLVLYQSQFTEPEKVVYLLRYSHWYVRNVILETLANQTVNSNISVTEGNFGVKFFFTQGFFAPWGGGAKKILKKWV